MKYDLCAKCDAEDKWNDIEERYIVTGEEGNVPVKVKTATCASCGHLQRID
jgi:hypothetical protein